MRYHKRGGDGGGDPRGAAELDAVGLGDFARLALPDHAPAELGLAAAYDFASGRISVSLAGATVYASRADLAAALELPPGPVGLAAGVDAAGLQFSSAEAIAAVSGFVRDRVLLGGRGDGGPASREVAAALQLVEEGKAFEVDWAGLVWAVVKGEVFAGTPRRYVPYLLHLMENQRPELFDQFDGRLSPQNGMLLGSDYLDLDLEQEESSLVYGGSQSIGDLEDMAIFGEVNVGAGLSLVRNAPLRTMSQLQEVGGVCNYQTLSPFQACLRQIQGSLPAIENAYFGVDKACRDTKDEVEGIKKMVMEKVHLISALMSDVQEELRERSGEIRLHEQSLVLMRSTVERHKMLIKKSLAEFQEYRNRVMCEEAVGGQNPAWFQVCQEISWTDQICSESFQKLLNNIREVEMDVTKLNDEVQRLKESSSIPDLNNGVGDDGEGEASLSKAEDRPWEVHGCHVSNTTQGGEQLADLIANPDKRSHTGERMDQWSLAMKI